MARVTIRDVARSCGVSEATVSNALADKPIVAPETKELVRRTAMELGYEISPVARALRTGRSDTVGLVVSNLANPFYGDVLLGISSVLTPRGYQTIICNTESRTDLQERHVTNLLRHKVDGIILLSHSSRTDDPARIISAGVPLVALWRFPGGSDVTFVGMDDEIGMQMAMEHLWALGHRRIALLRGHRASSAGDAREKAFRRFLRERGQTVPRSMVISGDVSIEAGREATRRLLAEPSPPTAIIGTSDLVALGATAALSEAGMSVPGSMSVVGFDDTFIAALPQIMLTAVSVPRRELGVRAAEALLRRIDDPAQPAERILLRPDFKARCTTGAPPPA